MQQRYLFDRSVRFHDGNSVLVGGSPTGLLRCGPRGARLVERLRHGSPVEPDGAAERELIDRLVSRGMLHPCPTPLTELADADLVVIVPVKDRPGPLAGCLEALVESGVRSLVVVDDGSVDADAHRAVAEEHGAVLVRSDESLGPGGARNLGARFALDSGFVRGAALGFVDSDVEVVGDWWAPLLAHLDEPAVGVIAPRVRTPAASGSGAMAAYEQVASPLDLGPEPAPIVSSTRVAYVPAAALMVRVDTWLDVGGFDSSLIVGEDVDFLWRCNDAGWRSRYEPQSEVHHSPPQRLLSLLRRRFDYGTSAAALDVRHRGEVVPARLGAMPTATCMALLSRVPYLAVVPAALTFGLVHRRLPDIPGRARIAATLTLQSHIGTARQLARMTTRPLLPVASLALAWPPSRSRAIVALAGSVAVAAAESYRRRPADRAGSAGFPDPVRFALWAVADDAAYSAGVWAGAIRHRRPMVVLPSISA